MSALATDADTPGGADPIEPPSGGSHFARNAAIAVGVVLVLLVILLATRQPSEDRFGANPLVGRVVPAVEGTALDGSRIDIDTLRGKWVVVNFFATWCTPCILEHPELVRFSEQHAAAGDAEVISVAYETEPQALRDFFFEKGGTWPVLVGDDARLALEFGVTGVPESFVVSPAGQVVADFTGVTADGLNAVIAEVEKEIGAAANIGDDPVTAAAPIPSSPAVSPSRPLRRSWMPWIPLFVVVALVLVIGSLGDTGPTTNEERVVAIARTVKCPECSGESVAESNSSFSWAARIEIAEQVQAGRTDDDVRDYLEAKYPGILLTPTGSGVAGLIWVIPVVVFVFSLAGLVVVFTRWSHERPTGSLSDADRDLVAHALDDEHRRQADGPERPTRR